MKDAMAADERKLQGLEDHPTSINRPINEPINGAAIAVVNTAEALRDSPDDTSLDVKTAAAYLSLAPETVRELFNDRKLEGFQNGPKGRIRIRLGLLRKLTGDIARRRRR